MEVEEEAQAMAAPCLEMATGLRDGAAARAVADAVLAAEGLARAVVVPFLERLET